MISVEPLHPDGQRLQTFSLLLLKLHNLALILSQLPLRPSLFLLKFFILAKIALLSPSLKPRLFFLSSLSLASHYLLIQQSLSPLPHLLPLLQHPKLSHPFSLSVHLQRSTPMKRSFFGELDLTQFTTKQL